MHGERGGEAPEGCAGPQADEAQGRERGAETGHPVDGECEAEPQEVSDMPDPHH